MTNTPPDPLERTPIADGTTDNVAWLAGELPAIARVCDGKIVVEPCTSFHATRTRYVDVEVRPVRSWWPWAHRAVISDCRTGDPLYAAVRATHRAALKAAVNWSDDQSYRLTAAFEIPEILDDLNSVAAALSDLSDEVDAHRRGEGPEPAQAAYEELAERFSHKWAL